MRTTITAGLSLASPTPAACGPAPDPVRGKPIAATGVLASATSPRVTEGWIGRWAGPERLFLVIAQDTAPGRYAITINGDLDSIVDRVTGVARGAAIRFERAGRPWTLYVGDGAATGLKWLAGKRDCIMVRHEGFCRD